MFWKTDGFGYAISSKEETGIAFALAIRFTVKTSFRMQLRQSTSKKSSVSFPVALVVLQYGKLA